MRIVPGRTAVDCRRGARADDDGRRGRERERGHRGGIGARVLREISKIHAVDRVVRAVLLRVVLARFAEPDRREAFRGERAVIAATAEAIAARHQPELM